MAKLAFLLIGEPFLAEEKYKAVVRAVEKKHPGEISRQTCRLSDQPIESVLTEARTLPFLAEAQIFRILDAETLKSQSSLETLARYFEAPAEKSYLVFFSSSAEAEKRLAPALGEYGEVFRLEDRQKKSASSRFIREKMKHFGMTVEPAALRRLEEMGGEVPAFLDGLLEQLVAYAGKQKKISAEMVTAFEEEWEKVDAFKLTDAIAGGRTGEALAAMRKLLTEDEREGIPLIGLIHWQLRRLWLAKTLLEEGRDENVILKKCRVSPRQAPYFMRRLKTLSRDNLENALESLFGLDWRLKTGRAEGRAAYESWLVRATS